MHGQVGVRAVRLAAPGTKSERGIGFDLSLMFGVLTIPALLLCRL